MPAFLNYALSPIATDTGLAIVPGDASGTTSGSSTFGNGLAYPSNQSPNFNTVSNPSLTPGAAQKPSLVDFYHSEATRLLGQENIGRYLRDFNKKPQNEVFEDLVNRAVSKTGKTFETAVMKELILDMQKYENRLAQAVNDIKQNPYDLNRETKLYRLFKEMGAELNQADKTVQSDAVPVQNDAVPVQADATKSWWNNLLWGGRKTARNHKRGRSRSRSRKQYKKLKRSSRNRRR